MGGFSLPLTHLHCSAAQLSKHFHAAPSASSHRELSDPGPIWSGSAGTPRSPWQRATSWLCLRIRFYWEAAFPAEQILLQQRGDSDSTTIVLEVTFSHFYGFKSQPQSRSLSSTKCSLELFPTCHRASTGTLAQQGHQPCAPAAVAATFPAAPSLPLQHVEIAASCILSRDENGRKALGNCRELSMWTRTHTWPCQSNTVTIWI